MAKAEQKTGQGEAAAPGNGPESKKCSFCGKFSSPSRQMIAGPPNADGQHDLFICEECVDVCVHVFIDAGIKRWLILPKQEGENA